MSAAQWTAHYLCAKRLFGHVLFAIYCWYIPSVCYICSIFAECLRAAVRAHQRQIDKRFLPCDCACTTDCMRIVCVFGVFVSTSVSMRARIHSKPYALSASLRKYVERVHVNTATTTTTNNNNNVRFECSLLLACVCVFLWLTCIDYFVFVARVRTCACTWERKQPNRRCMRSLLSV